MAIDINFPPSEENNNEELHLSLFTTSSHPQPNIQLEEQPQPQPQPQPKRYKPNPFDFRYIPLDTPNPSSLLVEYDFLKLPQPQPYTPSLQENHSLVPPLQQNNDMHEKELLPSTCNLSSQKPNPKDQDQEKGPSGLRPRKKLVRARRKIKTDTIALPYPWATSKRATVQSLEYLLSNNIVSISGVVKCKSCNEKYEIQFDLKEKFKEVATFIIEERDNMHDRAPKSWDKCVLPTCNRCRKENSLEPVLNNVKKKTINWLFLLLGQMIGCCNINYLKYFCKHTKNHRTGAKDRLIYVTYLVLCKQLCPNGPFDP
ncbi:hypothetical protein TanjilG_28313 [Lupinus angustifolius]|uniref:DUF7086 domain-containing protein n=1 Tax=Lupinus angustifolius TaxID=3871 RepID=A0A4P1RI73_LUPAN|nr:PREDICTED: uncharacterized protein LOC109347121 [Lupinus angustifolius]OIW11222.1 hypothetical protein TanjilG_28313 [Lupinus angustifolius]